MCMIETSPQIRTRRLVLRDPSPSDAASLATWCNDYDLARMTSRMPWPYEARHAEEFIETALEADRRRDVRFVIEQEDDGVVGVLGFSPSEDERIEVGYWIGRPWWGRGLATEALTGALEWAGRDWRQPFVTAGHFADNPASGAVLCKAGFLYTGDVQARFSKARGAKAQTRMMVWLP